MEILDNPTQEELFDLWCEELIQAGYIHKVLLQEEIPSPIILFEGLTQTRGKVRQKLLEPVTYKPDRVILWEEKSKGIFFTPIDKYKECYFTAHYIPMYGNRWMTPAEVKAPPGYGGSHGSDESFRVKQKWVYDKAKLLVNKVYNYPNSKTKSKKKNGEVVLKYKNPKPYLWLSTFTPTRYFYTDKTFEHRKISNWMPVTLSEFIKSKNPTAK